MSISKESLEARLKQLKDQAEQLKQQYLATTGAIADSEYWLAEEAKADPTPDVKE